MSDLNDKLTCPTAKIAGDETTNPTPAVSIYRDKVSGEIYHSVTRILGATAPEEQQKALAKWLERPDSTQTRDMAAAQRHCRPQLRRICSQNRSTPRPSNSSKTQQLARWRRWPLSSTKSGHQMGSGKSHSRSPACSLERIRFCSRAPRLDPGSRNRHS